MTKAEMVERINFASANSVNVQRMSTEALRSLKKEIEDELSIRHKHREDIKCSCWTCGHCYYDENAHPTYPRGRRGGYKCMEWSKHRTRHGRLIPTKYKAPSWCPKRVGEEGEVKEDV